MTIDVNISRVVENSENKFCHCLLYQLLPNRSIRSDTFPDKWRLQTISNFVRFCDIDWENTTAFYCAGMRTRVFRLPVEYFFSVYWYKAKKKVHNEENNRSVNSLTYIIVFFSDHWATQNTHLYGKKRGKFNNFFWLANLLIF